ncbi:MAG: Rpn family recombination-promoting nuclease/putative transposase [Prevotellaceae bacterium]|jgi:predicted transposase/invertase (TIGR01784 family)|nr:Rpn family recombination-promoting nuclease/putative transposase [Prevotellaceae bacterium]
MAKKEKKEKKAKKDAGAKVFMNPKTDFGFKKLFGIEQVLREFLNSLEVFPEKISAIGYLPLEQLGVVEKDRKAVYDIYATTASGKRYIVEMQVSRQDHFEERMLFYASHSVIEQVKKGKQVKVGARGKKVAQPSYAIDGVYVIAIVDFELFKEKEVKDVVVEQVHLMRQAANLKFTDKFQLVIIELPKFKKTLDELVTLKDKFLFSLKHMDKLAERPAVMVEEVLQVFYEKAELNKLTTTDMRTYNRSIEAYEGMQNAMSFARREGVEIGEKRGEKRGRMKGIEQGIKRGRKEGIKEGIVRGEKRGEKRGRMEGRMEGIEEERIRLVKNSYKANLSFQQIAEITGFTEEQIYAILDS